MSKQLVIKYRIINPELFVDESANKGSKPVNMERIDIPIEYFHKISKVEIDFVLIDPPERIENDL